VARVVYQGVPGDGAGTLPIVSSGTNYVTSGFSLTAGQTYTYQIPESGTVLAVAESPLGSDAWQRYALTNSIANVEANAGSYWYNNPLLYVHTFTNTSPTNVQIIACRVSGDLWSMAKTCNSIRNFRIRLAQRYGIYFLSACTGNVVACSNTIYASLQNGLIFYTLTNCEASYNTIFNNSANGIYLAASCTNCTIHHNTIYGHTVVNNDCGVYGGNFGNVISNNTFFGNGIGIAAVYGANWLICGNTCYSNNYGISVDTDTGSNTVNNNIVANNGTGISISSSPNVLCFNNIAYNNGIGVYVARASSTNVQVFNNTLFNNTYGISGYFNAMPTNPAIFNNIIWAVGTNNSCFNNPPGDLRSDYNDLYISGGACVKKGAIVTYGANTTNFSLAAWRAAITQDLHSISADPRVISTNLPLPDLHILLSSPCCRSATNVFQGVAAPAADMDGKTRTALVGYDQGCYRRPSIGGTSILVR